MKTNVWRHSDGIKATILAIACCLTEQIAYLVEVNIDVIASSDMKLGIDIDKIMMVAATIKALVDLDPRGGIFLQTDVEEALVLELDDNNIYENMLAKAPTYFFFLATCFSAMRIC